MKKILLLLSLVSCIFAKEININVEKMHCPMCTTMIKKVIKKLDGVQKVKVRLNTKNAYVKYDESKTNPKEILKAIATTGYEGKITN